MALSMPSGISERPEPEIVANVGAEYRLGHTLGALEREARGAFVSDDSIKRAAILCFDGVADEVRRDFAIRVEDVAERLLGAPLANRGKVRANVLAKVPGAMTRGTGRLENLFTAVRVPLHRERGSIFRDHFLPWAGNGIAEKFRRQFFHLCIGAAEQDGAPGEGNLVGWDDAALNRLQQWKEAAAPAEHGEHDLSTDGGAVSG